MRSATRFAPLSRHFSRNAVPGGVRRWLLGAALGLLATQALAIPLPLGFENVASLLNTGGVPLTGPTDAAIAPDGTVYIANGGANNIVKVQPDGTAAIWNVAGVGTFNFPACDALDSAGNLYISDLGNARIVKVTPAGVGSVVSTGAVTLAAPAGIAIDYAGNIFVADIGNNTVVEVPASGPAVTIGITGVGALSGPNGVSVDASGNLYVADSGNSRIVVVAGASSGATAGTVLNITGQVLNTPHGVTTDNAGTVYINDTGNYRIVKVAPDGTGTVVDTPLLGFAVNDHLKRSASGTLYVADQGSNNIVEVQDTAVDFGKVQLGAATPSNQTLRFTIPANVTVSSVKILTGGADSKDFVTGAAAPCIRHGVVVNCAPVNNDCTGATNTVCKVGVDFLPTAPGLRHGAVVLEDAGGSPIITVPLHGWGSAPVAAIYPGTASVIDTGGVQLPATFQSAFDGAGNQYVGALGVNAVYKIPAQGGALTQVNTGPYSLNEPAGVAVDGAGNLFISDYLGNRVVVVSADGTVNLLTINNLPGPPLTGPLTLQFDAAGALYIADYSNGRIIRVSALSVTDSGASGSGAVVPINGFSLAGGFVVGDAVDALGNLYVVDYQGGRIIKVQPNGTATVLTVPGFTLAVPYGVATDLAGNVYIFNAGTGQILQVTPSGTASVVALPGIAPGYLAFNMTVSPTGNLYFDDFVYGRVIELNVATPSPLVFPDTDVGSLSAALTASVMNLGDLPLMLTQAPSYPSAFPEDTSVSGRCAAFSLGSSQSCVLAADFRPNAAGAQAGNIVVQSNSLNAGNATQNVPVAGNGIAVTGISVSVTSLSFFDQVLNTTSAAKTVTLRNSGQVALDIASIAASGDFTQTSTCASSLAVGAICTINVSFVPTATGVRTGTLTVTTNAPSSPDTVSLSGTGVDPLIQLSAASLDFGQTINNQLTSRTVTLTNTGTGTLVVSGLTVSPGYSAGADCGSGIPAGGSCHVLVVFQPTAVGPISGQLVIQSNAGNGPATVALTGENLAEPVNGTGGGAVGEDVLVILGFASWWRRRLKGRALR